jgi:hypothetical protein
MEGLEIILMVIGHVLAVIFDPIIFALKAAKKWFDAVDPSNLPEVLTFDDMEPVPKFGVEDVVDHRD